MTVNSDAEGPPNRSGESAERSASEINGSVNRLEQASQTLAERRLRIEDIRPQIDELTKKLMQAQVDYSNALRAARAIGTAPTILDDDENLVTEVVYRGGTYDDFTNDVVMLWGYLKDLNDGHYRLYLNPEFNEYIDFRADSTTIDGRTETADYVHHVHVTNSPIGGTFVWVRRSARLRHTVVRSATQVADYLRGQISVNFLSQTGVGNAMLQSAVQRGQQGQGPGGGADVNVSYVLGGCGSYAYGGPCPG